MWNDLSATARHGICLAILAIIAVGFMAPDLFSSRVLVGGDIVQWKAMAQSLFDWEATTGERPLWATGPFMGMPAIEISYPHAVPQVDDLARLLRSLMWPLSHLLILFAGTYGLVFHLTRDHWGGVLAAVAFGLTTYLPILLIAGHHSKYVALALVPWLLWAFAYVRRSPGLMSALLFAVATAASLRAGHVQITYYAAFTLGIWWLVDLVRAFRNGTTSTVLKATVWMAVGGVLGILMVADPYLAKAQYKAYTIRGAAAGATEGGMGWDYAMGWSQAWGELWTLFIANAYGNTGATYWGPKIFTAGPHYVGGVVLLLASYAVVFARRPAVWGLAIAGLLMTAFSLGENLEMLNRLMFDYFPLFDAFRVPETWLSMVALVLAVLAAFGLRDATRQRPDKAENEKVTADVQRLGIAAVALAGLMAIGGTAFFSFDKPNEYELLARQVAVSRPDVSLQDPQTQQFLVDTIERVKDERRDLFRGDALRTLIFVLLGAGALWAMRRRKLPTFAGQAILVILVTVDLGGVGRRYFNEDALVPARQARSVVPEFGFDTFLKERRQEAGGLGRFRVLSLEGDPVTTSRPAFHHETLSGYHGAKLRRYQDFLDYMLFDRRAGLPEPNALAITNTRYVVAGGTLPGMQPVFSEQGYTVFQVPNALPRAWFVDSVAVVQDAQALWQAFPTIDPEHTALMTEDPSLAPAPDSAASSVQLMRYGPEEIVWSVTTAVPRLFVASEVYYPAGWSATLNGDPVPILPANHLLRSVVVPAGSHELRMTFQPAGRRAGLAVSWASSGLVYGILLLLLVGQWRRRSA